VNEDKMMMFETDEFRMLFESKNLEYSIQARILAIMKPMGW
jgi:hypothetical protein